ncbi:MAG: HD domain-containing protein [Lentisphaeria bacterium]|nr:HD domain-containing protein [Lentisphaeria bacterium]
MDPLEIITYFYPEDTPLRRVLILHSEQVRDKALQIAYYNKKSSLNREILINGAMLHDIGIGKCNAKDIFCEGTEHYLKHGIIGAEMLRDYGKIHGIDMEVYARICERHTGSGLTAEEIRSGNLPLPEQDFLPETPEEKVICLADKFYSKSGRMQEKPLKKIIHSMERFGAAPAARFEEMGKEFRLRKIPRLTMDLKDIIGLTIFNFVIANLTYCLCLLGEAFLKIKLWFLLFMLIRCLYFYRKKRLFAADVWIYELFFILIIFAGFFMH